MYLPIQPLTAIKNIVRSDYYSQPLLYKRTFAPAEGIDAQHLWDCSPIASSLSHTFRNLRKWLFSYKSFWLDLLVSKITIFLSHDLWCFLAFCGIFRSFDMETRNVNSDSASWGGSCQTWNVPNCLLVDVGCSYNACKGTKYSARVPPPSCIPRTIWMLCHTMCHFEICTDLHIFYSAN